MSIKINRQESGVNKTNSYKKVRKVLLATFLTFSFFSCTRKPLAYFQPSLTDNFVQKKRHTFGSSPILSKLKNIDSVSVVPPIIKIPSIPSFNELQASISSKLITDFHREIIKKKGEMEVSSQFKPKPKPNFFKRTKEKLKNWHPFKRKHKFSRKLGAGLVLTAIAIVFEAVFHLQTLTIIFGIAAVWLMIRGLKRLF